MEIDVVFILLMSIPCDKTYLFLLILMTLTWAFDLYFKLYYWQMDFEWYICDEGIYRSIPCDQIFLSKSIFLTLCIFTWLSPYQIIQNKGADGGILSHDYMYSSCNEFLHQHFCFMVYIARPLNFHLSQLCSINHDNCVTDERYRPIRFS